MLVMKQIIAFITLLTCISTFAAPIPPPDPNFPYFRAGEFNLDLYGTGSLGDSHNGPNGIRAGLGAGATYFYTKALGFGFRAESDNADHSFLDRASGRVIIRAPLWDRFAPYGYANGVFHFERDEWSAGAGGGLEYRFNPKVAVFTEAGADIDLGGHGKLVGAAGLRLSF